jgi:hypothetical protein
MSATRRTILNRIIQIEAEVKVIRSDIDYRRIKRNLDILDTPSFGSRNISVRSPDDMSKTITVRKKSAQQKEIKDAYTTRLREYTTRLDKLFREKKSLEKQLFV